MLRLGSMLNHVSKLDGAVIALGLLVFGCHAPSDIAGAHDAQRSATALGLMTFPNVVPVFRFSSRQGKLVAAGKLGSNVAEPGDIATTISVQGYTVFKRQHRRSPNGWWQLGDDPLYLYTPMWGDRPQNDFDKQVQENFSFTNRPARHCPLLSLDAIGRLVPTGESSGSTVDITSLEEHYVQLQQRNMLFLSTSCVADVVGDDPFDLDREECEARVEAKLSDAEEDFRLYKIPYAVFCFGENFDIAWSFWGDDELPFLALASLGEPFQEISVHNVSPHLTAVATIDRSQAVLPPGSRLPLMVLNAQVEGNLFITATGVLPERSITIPINPAP